MGTASGLPISCFSGVVRDNMYEIFRKNSEMAMLSKIGGGTAYDFSDVRPAGSSISRGGTSDGILPFMHVYDSTIIASKQAKVRRGAMAAYLNINHQEYPEFLRMREPLGDVNLQCRNIHHGAVINNDFMNRVVSGDSKARELWKETLMQRVKTGEPYMVFIDNANTGLPSFWKENGIPSIKHSNLCSEIFLPTDFNHTLVCCLSSLNLARYHEWKDTNLVQLGIFFLDAVMEEFIQKGKKVDGISDAIRFAIKSRALGLGVLGFHSYLQSRGIPFESIEAAALNKIIFRDMYSQALKATLILGEEFGEPEWCRGTGRRNLTLLANAPTRSNAKLSGGVSPSTEPLTANYYIDDDAKGMFIRKNEHLEKLLEEKELNNDEVWASINRMKGSVQHLEFLSTEEKSVFKTAREIDQSWIVKLAAERQAYIDQGQSVNLFFSHDTPAKKINDVHIQAWKGGLKSLYYLRSESSLRADTGDECVVCEA